AAGTGGRRSERETAHAPGDPEGPPQRAIVQLVPQPHGSARAGLRELQRPGPLARQGVEPADRGRRGTAPRRGVRGGSPTEKDPDHDTPAGFLSLRDREDVHLRPRAGARIPRRPYSRRTGGPTGSREGPAVRADPWYHSVACLPAAPAPDA